VITLGRSQALPNLVRVQWAVQTPRGGNIYGSICDIVFFYSSTELQPTPVNRFSLTLAQKTLSDVRKAYFGWEMRSCEIEWCFLGRNRQLPAKIKCWITSKRWEIREICQWTMIMKLGSLFQIPSTKTETPASGGQTMTSYPVCNKTWLSGKPCITAEKLLWNAIRMSYGHSFRICHKNCVQRSHARDWCDVIFGWQHNLVFSETMHGSYKVTMDHYHEVMVGLSEAVMENLVKRPLVDKSR